LTFSDEARRKQAEHDREMANYRRAITQLESEKREDDQKLLDSKRKLLNKRKELTDVLRDIERCERANCTDGGKQENDRKRRDLEVKRDLFSSFLITYFCSAF